MCVVFCPLSVTQYTTGLPVSAVGAWGPRFVKSTAMGNVVSPSAFPEFRSIKICQGGLGDGSPEEYIFPILVQRFTRSRMTHGVPTTSLPAPPRFPVCCAGPETFTQAYVPYIHGVLHDTKFTGCRVLDKVPTRAYIKGWLESLVRLLLYFFSSHLDPFAEKRPHEQQIELSRRNKGYVDRTCQCWPTVRLI